MKISTGQKVESKKRTLPTFVRESGFDASIAALTKTHARMHELDEAIEWGLMHAPEHFFNIQDDFYLWKTARLVDGLPQLRILYRYNKEMHTVNLVAACEISASDSE
jgi:hypothetical protein